MATSETKVRVGHLLREARINRGDTAAAVGKLLGVSQQRITQWERGEGRPPIERAEAIAAYLGKSLTEVFHLIHVDHTGRAAIDPGITQTLDMIEETLQKLMLQQQHLAERLELRAEPDEDVDGG